MYLFINAFKANMYQCMSVHLFTIHPYIYTHQCVKYIPANRWTNANTCTFLIYLFIVCNFFHKKTQKHSASLFICPWISHSHSSIQVYNHLEWPPELFSIYQLHCPSNTRWARFSIRVYWKTLSQLLSDQTKSRGKDPWLFLLAQMSGRTSKRFDPVM